MALVNDSTNVSKLLEGHRWRLPKGKKEINKRKAQDYNASLKPRRKAKDSDSSVVHYTPLQDLSQVAFGIHRPVVFFDGASLEQRKIRGPRENINGETKQNLVKQPETFGETRYDSEPGLSPSVDKHIGSWYTDETVPRSCHSRPNPPNHEAHEHPSLEAPLEGMRPNVGYTSESRVADRIPMADLSTRKMTKDTEEGGRPPNLMVVRDLSHSKSPRDFQSGAMSELTSRSSPPLSEDSSKALSSSSGRDENISTSHHSSSLSQTSSKVSDSAAREATPNKDPNTLEGVLNDELRTEPAVAKLLYRSLVGKLEYAPPGAEVHIFDDGNSHSILSLLTIRDPRPIKHRGAFTYAPTTASGSSYSSSSKSPTGAKASLSGSGSSGGKGLTSSNDGSGKDTANDGIHGQSTKQQKSKTKSNASTSNNIQSLRCFHNISLPETFCVNHKTRDRFRSCGGPGFNNIQRLREHMASHHKQKPDELKCSGCKQDFANPKSLKEHTDTTDCVICCPDCNETFFKKTDRTAHQNANHSDGGKSVFYKELDEKLWEKLKDALKTFAISIQRGKASEDPSLAKWVEKNKERYMIGRSSNANYLLELGQWYVAWDTLRPLLSEEYVPEHPFYDYLPAAELGEEKIRLVFKQLVAGEIKVNGPPPNEIPTQITWYDHHLGKALRIASRTQLKMNSKPQYDDDTYDSLPNSSLPQQTAFDSQVPIAQFNISTTMQGEAPITYQPPLGMMNQRAHNMVHPTQGFYPIPGHQQQAVTMQNMPSVPSSSTDGMFWDGQPPHPESAVKLRRRR